MDETKTLTASEPAWLAFVTVFAKVAASAQQQQTVETEEGEGQWQRQNMSSDHGTSSSSGDSSSVIATVLFVPFWFYFLLVLVFFALECYHFISVWRFVRQSRQPLNGNQEMNFDIALARQPWWRRLDSDSLSTTRNNDETLDENHTLKVKLERLEHIRQKLTTYTFHHTMNKETYVSNGCPICFSDFDDGEKVAFIRKCNCFSRSSTCANHLRHKPIDSNSPPYQPQNQLLFHSHCLMHWLEQNASCPFCRMELVPINKKKSVTRLQDESLQLHTTPTAFTMPITALLEIASMEVELYLFHALSYLGEFFTSHAY